MTTPDFDTNKDSDLVGMVEAIVNENHEDEIIKAFYKLRIEPQLDAISDSLDAIVKRLELLERYSYVPGEVNMVHEQLRAIEDTHANYNSMLVEHHGRITELETHNHDDEYSTGDHDHDDAYCEAGHYHDITCGDSYT